MIRIATALALAALAFSATAADIEAGRAKSTTCQACHGPDGNGTGDPQYPRLAGQHADYLVKALKDYRSGERANVIMAGFAGTLSDKDIADLAAFYAAQKGPLRDLSHVK